MARRPDPLSRRPAARSAAAPAPAPAAGPRPYARLIGVGLVALLQFLWLRWFLTEPLPNAGNAGGTPITRSLFLWRAFPEVVPGLTFSESYLGLALGELSHVENLPQRLPVVAAAGLIAAAAVGLGLILLRLLRVAPALARLERLPIAFGVGASVLGAATLVLGRLGLLEPWPIRIGLGLLALVGAAAEFRPRPAPAGDVPPPDLSLPARSTGALLLVVGPFLAIMALGSMLPTIDFDAIEYHLQGPKEYYQAGRITFLEHNVYTSMPFGVEMLHLLGMVVLDDWWWGALAGQLLVAAHAPAAGAMVMLAARRWGSPRAALFAGLVYLTTPWIYRLAAIPYVEGPLCYYHAALAYVAGLAWTRAEASAALRLWGLAGLLAGGAMACKYPALISAAIPFGAVATADALRRRLWWAVPAFVAGWAVVMAPWLGKNVIDTGNPVYPLAYNVFGGRYWDPAMDAKWANAHGPKEIRADLFAASVVDVAGRSDWQSPLYAALAPLAFLRPGSRRTALALGGFVLYLFLTWWLLTHRLDRFWLPLLPALAVLAGLGADWDRSRSWALVLGSVTAIAVAANAVYSSTALTGLNEWTGDLTALRTRVPEMLNEPLVALDRSLPPGAKPLLVGQAAVFHLDRPLAYNTVFDDEILEVLARDRTPEEIARGLAALGITHVYVDWKEIERYRSPGNYGFTPFVTRERLDGLVAAGVLDPPTAMGALQDAYRVRPAGEGRADR